MMATLRRLSYIHTTVHIAYFPSDISLSFLRDSSFLFPFLDYSLTHRCACIFPTLTYGYSILVLK